MIYWICAGDGLSMISIWSSVLKLLSGRCSRSTRRWMRRTLSRRREWTSIKVIMRRWFDTEWLRRTSIRRATSTDPMSLRPCSHRKWMLFRMDMTDDRVREGWRTRRDRVFARRTELKPPPQSPRDLERCPRSSHAAAWRDVDTSWQCSVHYFVSKFRCDLIYLKSALVTVVCPCTPWCRIHDIHIWWTSCAHSAVKGKVTKVHFIFLSLTRHFIIFQWPLSVILSFSARSYENSFIWSSSMHLSQSKWMGDFLVRVESSCVLSVLSRFENRRRVWEWKKSHFSTSESASSRFLDFPRNGQYFPSESPPCDFFHLVSTTFVRTHESSFFAIVSQSSRERYVPVHWQQFVWKRKLNIFVTQPSAANETNGIQRNVISRPSATRT